MRIEVTVAVGDPPDVMAFSKVELVHTPAQGERQQHLLEVVTATLRMLEEAKRSIEAQGKRLADQSLSADE